jgi:23S rRNA (cytosine1962-C5)-methyltransferase
VFSLAQKEKGLRAYKDINLFAMKLLTPGGILATFSCSGLVPAEDFKTMLAWAAQDANRSVKILEWLGQPADHPVFTRFPESEYLKGAICWIA